MLLVFVITCVGINFLIFLNFVFVDGQHSAILYLLHAFLIPSTHVVKNQAGKKVHIKFSLKDSQNSFMLVKENIQQIEAALKSLEEKNEPIQPLIIVIGSVLDPKEILVDFDGIKFKFFTVLKAVDTCFKIFHLFNLKYPSPSILVWTFIQQYFYKVITKYDRSFPSVACLKNNLDKSINNNNN